MSDMEMFYGVVAPSQRTDVPEILDDDEYYKWEDNQDGKQYYCVNDRLFEVRQKSSSIDVYGGTLLIPPSGTNEFRFLCYWYNGGAGRREVIEDAIKDLIKWHGL